MTDIHAVGELKQLFVSHEVVHGGGVGRELFKYIQEVLKRKGKKEMIFDSGIRYQSDWGFFEKLCQSTGTIIPNKYGPGWHAKAWNTHL
jgi:hypothetical protein